MRGKWKSILQYALSVLAAGVLLYFSFRSVNWNEFVACLKACRWEYVLMTALCCVGVHITRSLRYHMLLKPVDASIPFRSSFNSINIGLITNLVLPRAGELIRCGYVTRYSRRKEDGSRLASLDKVFGTVVVERGWDIVFGLMTIILLIAVLWERFGSFFLDNLAAPLREKAAGLWLVAAVIAVVAALVWAVRRFRDRNPLCRKISDFFQGIGTGLTTCLHMEKGWAFLVYTLIIWMLYWGQSWFILLAMKGIDPAAMDPGLAEPLAVLQGLGPVDALFLTLAGSVSSVIPVPGGFGAFHGVVAGALSSVYCVPFSLGLLFATLTHETVTLTEIVLGLGSFVYESIHKLRV